MTGAELYRHRRALRILVVVLIPLGIWTARSERGERVLRGFLDTAQVMPVFVYLGVLVLAFGIRYPPTVLATVVYAPFAVGRLGSAGDAPADAWLSVAALGVVCTAVALALFFALIREVGPQRALVITFVNPAVAVLLGVLLLDEPFTLGLAIGLPLVLAGCVLATRRSPARTTECELADVDAAVP